MGDITGGIMLYMGQGPPVKMKFRAFYNLRAQGVGRRVRYCVFFQVLDSKSVM
jgi:hypothetical protein